MKEFIERERSRLQAKLDEFLEAGCYLKVFDEKNEYVFRTVISDLRVTRVQPHFDTAGNHAKTDFWVMWNSLGYNNGFQYTHTAKIVKMTQDDDYLLDLYTDAGERLHLEKLIPECVEEERLMKIDLEKWRRYQSKNGEYFDRIDKELFREHQEIADTWLE